jgi:hypothetical protein
MVFRWSDELRKITALHTISGRDSVWKPNVWAASADDDCLCLSAILLERTGSTAVSLVKIAGHPFREYISIEV